MFDPDLALEMLALAEFSERFPTRDGERVTSPSSMFLRPQQPPRPLFVRGSPLVAAHGLVRGDFKSDSRTRRRRGRWVTGAGCMPVSGRPTRRSATRCSPK